GEALRSFVARGGTLYASDLRAEMVYAAFPRRRPPTRANLAILPQVEEAERDWIKARAPVTKAGTVAETLRKAQLSQDLTANLNLLVALVESSSLVEGGLGGASDNAVRMVGAELQGVNWKVPPEDVKTIARELVNWEAAIRDGYRARLRTKVSKSKLALAQPI